jgi:hypothetical protein
VGRADAELGEKVEVRAALGHFIEGHEEEQGN